MAAQVTLGRCFRSAAQAVCCCLLLGSVIANSSRAAEPALAEALSGLVREELLDHLKGEYKGDKDWGATKEIKTYAVKGKGLKLSLRKQTKQVNHGLWKQYRIVPMDPRQTLRLKVDNLRSAGPGQVAFQLFMTARVHGEGCVERWRQGIKMLNFSAAADSTIEVRLDCEVALKFVPGKSLLNDIVVEPKVTAASLRLAEIDLQHIGKLGGTLAHELGDTFRATISRELSRREGKLVEKLNSAIQKKQDRLRFSPEQFIASGWAQAQAVLAGK